MRARLIFTKTATLTANLGRTRPNRAPDGEVDAAMSEPWLSADEIAAHLCLTKDTFYLWTADKAMPGTGAK